MKKLISKLGILVFITLFLSACSEEPQENVMKDGTPVEVQIVAMGDISASYRVPGTVASAEIEQIFVPLAARCLDVYVEEGEVVNQDKALFLLDVGSAMDTLEAAQLNYVDALQTYEDQSALLDEQLRLQENDYQNQLALFEIGAVSQLELDMAKMSLDQTKATRVSTLSKLEMAIKSAESSKKQAEDSLKGIDSDGVVRAPISGTVASLSVYEDAHIQPGAPLVTIASNQELEVLLSVSEYVISKLRVGDEAKVLVPSLSVEFTADILEVANAPKMQSTLYAVTVAIPDDVENLLNGMFADVTLYTEAKEDVVIIPSESVLIRGEGQYVVILDENNMAQLVDVQVGMIGDGVSEITSGLLGGETIVVLGQSYLEQGDLARIVPTEE